MNELSVIYSGDLAPTVHVIVSIAFLAACAAAPLLLRLRKGRFFSLAPSALAIALGCEIPKFSSTTN